MHLSYKCDIITEGCFYFTILRGAKRPVLSIKPAGAPAGDFGRMMGLTRRERIRDMLATQPFVSYNELEKLFPTLSGMTLRRDIAFFEQMGECIRVRGGARSMKFITTSVEDSFPIRLNINREAKERIAEAALPYAEAGRSVYLDAGTTILYFAARLPDQRMTFLTSGPNIAMELLKKSKPIVNLVGGMINRDNLSVAGPQALEFIANVNIDLAFLTPSGFSPENGFTSGNYAECEFKRLILEKARRTIVLMDHTKMDKCLPYTIGRLEDIQVFITDQKPPALLLERAALAGVEMVAAD